MLQKSDNTWEALEAQLFTKKTICKERESAAKLTVKYIKAVASEPLCHAMALAQEKGAFMCPISLPLEQFRFSLYTKEPRWLSPLMWLAPL